MGTFLGLLPPDGTSPRAKLTLRPSLVYWQRYCTVLQQRASAKLCGAVQGMQSRNFRRGHHPYSAGRPSHWASAHILALITSAIHWKFYLQILKCIFGVHIYTNLPSFVYLNT